MGWVNDRGSGTEVVLVAIAMQLNHIIFRKLGNLGVVTVAAVGVEDGIFTEGVTSSPLGFN